MADIITMPKLGFDMAEGTLVRWLKKEGDNVSKGDVIAEIETDKATVEVESNYSGILRQILVDQGSVLPVNEPMAIIGTKEEDISNIAFSDENKQEKPTSKPDRDKLIETQMNELVSKEKTDESMERIRISPLARKLAKENDISIKTIKGSGPSGRIVKKDIDLYLNRQISDPSKSGISETIPLSKLRTIIGKRMVASKTTIPHFYVSSVFRVDKLLDLRNQFNNALNGKDKISVNDLIVKATALALRDFKNLNASLEKDKVVHHGSINIGIAVSVEEGLLTVVCKNTDIKSLIQISRESREMAERARAGKVKPADIEGSTFSISNLGMFNVEDFIAIINPPEAAILALGAARELPVVEDGSIKIGKELKATISVDHRISDGAEAARFMQRIDEIISSPIILFTDI